MNEINGNVFDMEKEQLKAALKGLAKSRNVSLSDLAIEAGVAPSTITGFINDVPGRGHYGLSAKTQNKISETFPEFKDLIEEPVLAGTFNVPVIGMWGKDYRIHPLELGMSNSFIGHDSPNIRDLISVIRRKDFFHVNLNSNAKFQIGDTRYYLFEKKYAESLDDINMKQVYASCENGYYIGFLHKDKQTFYLNNFFGEPISCGKVLQASAIEWTRQV